MAKTLDDIESSVDTVMTAELVRLFKYAGCNPTVCHACNKPIKVGEVFKLCPHPNPHTPEHELHDEMLCEKCDAKSLVKRDSRERAVLRREARRHTAAQGWTNRLGGYSRLSKR